MWLPLTVALSSSTRFSQSLRTSASVALVSTEGCGAAAQLPIIAAGKDVTGNPNRVIDLWKGDTGRHGYSPNDPGQEAFFGPLRQIAPREKMMRLHVMPYSPLR